MNKINLFTLYTYSWYLLEEMSTRTSRIQYHRKINNSLYPWKEYCQGLSCDSCDEKLNFKEHIHCQINMAYKMVRVIIINFKYFSISSFVLVYKSLVSLDHIWTIVIVYAHHTGSLIVKPWRKYKRRQLKYYQKSAI